MSEPIKTTKEMTKTTFQKRRFPDFFLAERTACAEYADVSTGRTGFMLSAFLRVASFPRAAAFLGAAFPRAATFWRAAAFWRVASLLRAAS